MAKSSRRGGGFATAQAFRSSGREASGGSSSCRRSSASPASSSTQAPTLSSQRRYSGGRPRGIRLTRSSFVLGGAVALALRATVAPLPRRPRHARPRALDSARCARISSRRSDFANTLASRNASVPMRLDSLVFAHGQRRPKFADTICRSEARLGVARFAMVVFATKAQLQSAVDEWAQAAQPTPS